MSLPNIALMGRARCGKDTAAAHLMRQHAYVRLAFADPLKGMALEINPLIPTAAGIHVRLRALIADVGWEYAKDTYPEVRRILQHVGQTIRERDPDYWVALLMRQVDGARSFNIPVIVTDVRYPNEAEALREAGFTLVRIVRPILPDQSPSEHESETALSGFAPDEVVVNAGTPEELGARIELAVGI